MGLGFEFGLLRIRDLVFVCHEIFSYLTFKKNFERCQIANLLKNKWPKFSDVFARNNTCEFMISCLPC